MKLSGGERSRISLPYAVNRLYEEMPLGFMCGGPPLSRSGVLFNVRLSA